MKTPPNDYLKFWRVVRYYIKAKHGLGQADLDILLFLYSEGYFGQEKFLLFSEMVSWDVNRFKRLKRQGWIEIFRKRKGNQKTLYDLSYKSKRVIGSIYKILNGEEIPVSTAANPMFAKNVCYNDKVYRNAIIQMNTYQKEHKYRKPAPEEFED
jgi:hypothetical protein